MKPWRQIYIQLLVFIAATVLFFLTAHSAVNLYDEGLILTGALRVLNGEWPSRDFYANYGPLQFIAVAGFFKSFGTNRLVASLYDALIAGSVIAAVAVAVRRIKSRWIVVGCLLAECYVMVMYRVELYPLTLSTAIAILAGSLLVDDLSISSMAKLFAVAVLLNVLFITRYDLGIIGLVALGLPMIAFVAGDVASGTVPVHAGIRHVMLAAALLITILAITVTALGYGGLLGPAFEDIAQYNLENYARMRSLPFPGYDYLLSHPVGFVVIYAPLAIVFLGGS